MAQTVKRLPAMRETWVQFLGQEDPWRRKWQPTPVLLPGKFHGWTSLVGYSPWGRKGSDMTEQLHLFCFNEQYFFKLKHTRFGIWWQFLTPDNLFVFNLSLFSSSETRTHYWREHYQGDGTHSFGFFSPQRDWNASLSSHFSGIFSNSGGKHWHRFLNPVGSSPSHTHVLFSQ